MNPSHRPSTRRLGRAGALAALAGAGLAAGQTAAGPTLPPPFHPSPGVTVIPDDMIYSGHGTVYLPGAPEPGGIATPGGVDGTAFITYGGGVAGGPSTKNHADSIVTGFNTLLFSETTSTPGLPDPTENFTQNSWDIANQGWDAAHGAVFAQPRLVSDAYLHFSFKEYSDPINYQTVLGTLEFNPIGTLVSIEYNSNDTAVTPLGIDNGDGGDGLLPPPKPTIEAPEPSEWALLMAGMGLAGVALRRRQGRLLAA